MLIKTADYASITKAAAALGYTQSALSRNIIDLEDEWGITIFFRHKYKVKPTPSGEKLIYIMRQIVNLNDSLVQEVSEINGIRSGVVRIGSFESVAIGWVPKIIKRFYENYPLITFEIHQGDYIDIENLLREDRIDCGFNVAPFTQGYEFIPLVGDSFMAVLPPDHPMCALEKFPLKSLEEVPFILAGEGLRYDVGRMLKKAGVVPNTRLSAENDLVTMSLVEAGLGVSILPELVLSNKGSRNICVKELDTGFSRTVGIALKSGKSTHPATKMFVEYTKAYVSTINDAQFEKI